MKKQHRSKEENLLAQKYGWGASGQENTYWKRVDGATAIIDYRGSEWCLSYMKSLEPVGKTTRHESAEAAMQYAAVNPFHAEQRGAA